MYRVLLAVDSDEDRALNQARAVASLPDAADAVEVSLLHAFEDDEIPRELRRTVENAPGEFSLLDVVDAGEGSPAELRDVPPERREEIREQITSATRVASGRRAAEFLRERGIVVDPIEATGEPADAILRTAEEIDADSIVLGGRKRPPSEQALFGSVTQRVVRETDRPVTVTG